MKKQFNRMRQLANQTVGRAEKTEVLSEDLLQIERRMELVRLMSHNTHKKLVFCLQGQPGTDAEKRHKKLPLTALSQAMQEGGAQLGDESLIGKMMDVCGEAESRLASELMQHEVQIQRDILDPLNTLAEVDIPNILKQRKQLAKLVLDFDSAKTRYQATKSSNQATAAKVDSLKDEMDEALNKVEICKDQLSADMYNFASKEGDYARYYLMLLEAQADYHRRSLAALEEAIPNIQFQQDSWTEKPAFGTALEEHLKRSNRDIALPIEACVMMLLETGMKEEGLFRIAAGASKLKKLKAALDCSTSQLEEFYSDPHAVAGALKSYLRELPEPLMTFGLYDEWTQASNVSDPDARLQALWVTCDRMPKTHKANFRYLVKFLARLAQERDVNKMSPSNIAIVLGPNLLWAKAEGTLAEMAAATSVHVVAIIEPIIQHADWFFPEEVDFNVSGMFAMPAHPAASDPEAERKRPGGLVGQDGDAHPPRKDSTLNQYPEPSPRRAGTVIRKQPQLTSPAFQPLPPQQEGGGSAAGSDARPPGAAPEAEGPGPAVAPRLGTSAGSAWRRAARPTTSRPPRLPRGTARSTSRPGRRNPRPAPAGPVLTWSEEAPRNRRRHHPNKSAPSPRSLPTKVQRPPRITRPSPRGATRAKKAPPTPRRASRRRRRRPGRRPRPTPRLTTAPSPRRPPTSTARSPAPPGRRPSPDPGPTCRRPRNPPPATTATASSAPLPRSSQMSEVAACP
ncbi:rho GTPase-activating protein 17b [Syngnathoides biaculeatus]|uniref:rho GTPase-activating protein 17b n=1 Tax=Syngnathoides biaculeatus TaxID=300417 RepID=UPI002ADE0AE2|nr:rho GTPase-activating protein 17b [Syngnathoides biaculeatus]